MCVDGAVRFLQLDVEDQRRLSDEHREKQEVFRPSDCHIISAEEAVFVCRVTQNTEQVSTKLGRRTSLGPEQTPLTPAVDPDEEFFLSHLNIVRLNTFPHFSSFLSSHSGDVLL